MPLPTPIKYRLGADGVSILVESGVNALPAIPRSDHLGVTRNVPPDDIFNRGVRRGDTIMVTGDRPRLALMRTLPEDSPGPDLAKLGDGRLRVSCGEIKLWLDSCAEISTVFNPGSTEYALSDPQLPHLRFHLVFAQAQDWGVVARLTVANHSADTTSLLVEFHYGGLRRCGRNWRPAYFVPEAPNGPDNQCLITGSVSLLHDATMPDWVALVSVPPVTGRIEEERIVYGHELHLPAGAIQPLSWVAGRGATPAAAQAAVAGVDPEALIAESSTYYASLLAGATITTPSPVLDAGFRTSVWNLDSIYADPAWLEGVHWWTAYWTDLFKISAAISLGQFERARRALQFFCSHGYGGLLASGNMLPWPPEDWLVYYPYDGIFYYLFQLYQYVEATGDLTLAEEMWSSLTETLDRVFRERGGSGGGMLDWRLGCNAFLYQADQLGMPGAAASPSLMAAGMLARLADLGRRLGKQEEAAKWAAASSRIYAELPRLWNAKLGAFDNHLDLQGLAHSAHYYTDLIYPVLYAQLSEEQGWQSLAHLRQSLCFEKVLPDFDHPLRLMRVGDLKPSMFGNDNVMPTQMAEAARAFFLAGDHDMGAALLEAVALAATIHTEAPGNFPERMDDSGKGEFNYLFGNPIGSFAHAVIAGLFGLSLTSDGQTLSWSPAFPDAWDHAALSLPYARVSYHQNVEPDDVTRTYHVASPGRNLKFSVLLQPCHALEVHCNGRLQDPVLSSALERTRLEVALAGDGDYELHIRYRPLPQPLPVKARGPVEGVPGQSVLWELPVDIERISDPQGLLAGLRIEGAYATGTIVGVEGSYRLYFYLRDVPAVLKVDYKVMPPVSLTFKDAIYEAGRRSRGRVELPLSLVLRRPAGSGHVLRASWRGRDLQLALPSHAGTLWPTLTFASDDVPAEGVYEISYTVSDGTEPVLVGTERLTLKGRDEAAQTQIETQRDARSRPLDLSPFHDATTLWVTSKWRREEKALDLSAMRSGQGHLVTPAGIFRDPGKGPYIAVVEFGRSHPYTRETQSTGHPSTLHIPVDKPVEMVSLLYASEVESRLTGSHVGWLRLYYQDGAMAETRLEVGKQLDTLYSHWATDTVPVPVGRKGDSIHVLRVPCNPARTLQAFQISLFAADVQIGLIAANAVAGPTGLTAGHKEAML